jgi:chemotaxis protein methyltransferase CheR
MAFTFFFRDIHILEYIAKIFIPYVSGRTSIRIWDAGCAMGPEPYSLAIILAENMGHFAFRNVKIIASDYEPEFEKIVTEGVYSRTELERIPEDILKKYFIPCEKADYFRLIDNIRSKVFFQSHDLLSLNSIGDGFSLVLCKNVLLHLQPDERIEVIKMFHKSLAPDGLFATEHTQKLPKELEHLFEQVGSEAQLFRKLG